MRYYVEARAAVGWNGFAVLDAARGGVVVIRCDSREDADYICEVLNRTSVVW